jgi:hypothetical protein
MQSLDVYQSLWAMQIRRPGVAERTSDENFSMIAEAGFAGVCLDPGISEIEETLALKPYFSRYGLECMMNVFPNEVSELVPLLELAGELNARLVNIIGGVMPVEVADAVPLVYRWLEDASRFAFPVLFETHRNSLLNDLYYTLQLIGKVPEMRLCADLSHFVVDRELALPLQPRDRQYFEQILDRSDSFQGRVSSREQIQVQLDFPQHLSWVETFISWWEYGMRQWTLRNPQNARLIFLCELGPPSYAITDAGGKELSDRWLEALDIRGRVEGIWQEIHARK